MLLVWPTWYPLIDTLATVSIPPKTTSTTLYSSRLFSTGKNNF